MDIRGNMSSQHRRSKWTTVIVGPELTERQQQVAKSRKKLNKMSMEELTTWLEICELNVKFWKNRRTERRRWEESVEKVQKQIERGNAL
jgi:hypothetical protein